ncbi:MAG: type I restriction-modification system subunit M, partial [Synergistaceae bacterium]|nr:type I restriction-modification system subunit M [Synergistaceae bacterium]
MSVVTEMTSLVWSIADLLRGPYRPNQHKDVMLPLTVLRRLDCLLEPFKDKVTARLKRLEGGKIKNLETIIQRETGLPFYNSSRFTFRELVDAPDDLPNNLRLYIKRFSSRVSGIIEHFGFEEHIDKLDKSGRLFLVVKKFAELDLHPQRVKNDTMGYIFEELIRRFNEASNEEAGDHFTPREVIRLMVEVLFDSDDRALTTDGIVKTLYDPACGTGGMPSCAEEFVHRLNGDGRLEVFGQDYNDQAYAIRGSDMLIKGQNIDHIAFGDSFTQDKFKSQTFDYLLANPPFGVEWKPEEKCIRDEHEKQGFGGRFGAGLPRINDGAPLFLQQMWAKRKEAADGGTRMVIVFNGSPLFTGGAGSGESEIRRWVIENDWLEAIIALPDQLFYNTGIQTYLWVLSNRKEKVRRGKVALIDGTSFFKKMRKSLGNKRNEICDQQRADIVRLYGEFVDGSHVRIFDGKEFGFHRVTVERPLRLNFAT